MSNWLRDAVHTEIGHAHPLTGEQLTATKDLASPVAYYDPNSGDLSFLDPEGEVDGIILFRRAGDLLVDFRVHALKAVASVEWTFGEEIDPVTTASKSTRYLYPDPGTYEVSAEVTYKDTTTDTFELELVLA